MIKVQKKKLLKCVCILNKNVDYSTDFVPATSLRNHFLMSTDFKEKTLDIFDNTDKVFVENEGFLVTND